MRVLKIAEMSSFIQKILNMLELLLDLVDTGDTYYFIQAPLSDDWGYGIPPSSIMRTSFMAIVGGVSTRDHRVASTNWLSGTHYSGICPKKQTSYLMGFIFLEEKCFRVGCANKV